jgi:hypothetical protein
LHWLILIRCYLRFCVLMFLFCFVCLVSCVPNVTSVSRLSIRDSMSLDCPFVVSPSVFSIVYHLLQHFSKRYQHYILLLLTRFSQESTRDCRSNKNWIECFHTSVWAFALISYTVSIKWSSVWSRVSEKCR